MSAPYVIKIGQEKRPLLNRYHHLILDGPQQIRHKILFKSKSLFLPSGATIFALLIISEQVPRFGTIKRECHTHEPSGEFTMENKPSVGEKIKKLRETRDLTIDQLAEQSKTHKKFIEELESDQLVPSIAPLLNIARGLGVHLSTLMDDAPVTGAVVARQADMPATEIEFSGLGSYCASTLEFRPLAKNRQGRRMEPFIIDVHPSVPEECTFSFHEGEEFIYVLEGEIEVLYGGDRHVLSAGDSIYYDSATPHQVKTAGDKEARILAVIYA